MITVFNHLNRLDFDLHTEANTKEVSTRTEIYTKTLEDGKSYAAGDANVLTSKSLHCKEPRTFKDELHTIISSWRLIYGQSPWAEVASKYGHDHSITVSQIEHARQTDLKVIFFET